MKRFLCILLMLAASVEMLAAGFRVRGRVTDAQGEPLPGADNVELKELAITEDHKWKDKAIRDLDISRQAFIVMVKRDEKKIVPRGSTVLEEGDLVFMYKKV